MSDEQENLEGLETAADNPAWSAFQEKLTPEFYELVKPELAKWDKDVQSKFQSIHEKYKWAEELEKSGASQDRIKQAVAAADAIDKDPLAAYNNLKDFLQKSGKLTEKEAEKVADEFIGTDADETSPALKDMQAQIERLQGEISTRDQQTQEAQARIEQEQASQNLQREIAEVKTQFKDNGVSDSDIQEILKNAWFEGTQRANSGDNTIVPLTQVAERYFQWKDDLLSAPRAGSTAPRLLPTSGTNQGPDTDSKPIGSMTRGETQNLVAQWLASNTGK